MKKLRTFIISLLFTAAILYFLFTSISISSLMNSLTSISLSTLSIVFIVHLSSYIFRSMVFYKLFKKKNNIGLFYLINTHFIHNFYVHTIPASLGEFSFPLLLRKKVKPESSIPVLFVSRLLFLVMVLLIFPIALWFNFDVTRYLTTDYSAYLLWGLLLVPVLVIIIFFRKILQFLNKSRYFQNIQIKVTRTINNIKDDLLQLRNPGLLVQVIILTLLNIVMLTFKYLILMDEIGLHMSFLQIIFVSSIGIAFVILPLKSIGGFGTIEGAWAIGMLLLGFSNEEAIESGFVIHIVDLLNVIIIFIIGLIFQYTLLQEKSYVAADSSLDTNLKS